MSICLILNQKIGVIGGKELQILKQKNITSSPTLTGCLAKTSQDQNLKLTPQIRILFYKVFPDKIRSKQISVAETLFKSPQASIFFLIPHFQNVGLNVPLSKQNGGWVEG